jgi:acyl dehydratase
VAGKRQIYFDEVSIGQEIPSLGKGPIRTSHLVRWAAAMENWHRIHYDWRFATEVDGLPDVLVNGSWKQHVIAQMLKDWVGTDGWVWKIQFRYHEMDLPGDTINAWGRVARTTEIDGLGYVDLEIGLENSRGLESTTGTAVVVLPKMNGRAVPYPFVGPDARS